MIALVHSFDGNANFHFSSYLVLKERQKNILLFHDNLTVGLTALMISVAELLKAGHVTDVCDSFFFRHATFSSGISSSC